MGGHVRWCEQPQAFLALCHELDRWHCMPDQADLCLYVFHNQSLNET
jgi:hypothetical protein